MAINSFSTVFEARERKFQTEKIFQGEDVDLVARITNDGVPQDLTGYSVTGYYQPTDYPGTDQASLFYSLTAEISQDKKEVIVHWTYDKDFGKQGYIIWALLSKGTEHVYPVSWKVNLAHSPGYPPGETPEPIPQVLDFNDYTLLNAPWLPLAGGTVTGDVTVSTNLTATKLLSQDIKVNDASVTQVVIGKDAGPASGTPAAAIAIGYNATSNPFGVAIGTSADVSTNGDVAVGFSAKGTGFLATAFGNGAKATGPVSIAIGHHTESTNSGSLAIGYGAYSKADNAIQIGAYTSYDGEGAYVTPCNNTTANTVQIFNKQVFYTTGTPSSNPNTSDLILVKERAPWAVRKDEDIAFLATDWSGNPDMSKISLFDIAQRVNQCVAAIKGASIPKGDLPTDTSLTHLTLMDGTQLTMNVSSISPQSIDNYLKAQGHEDGAKLVRTMVIGSSVTQFSGFTGKGGDYLTELVAVDLSRTSAAPFVSEFQGCPKLNYVNIGPNITSIGNGAFSACPNLKSLVIPATVTGFGLALANNTGSGQLTVTWQGRTKAQVQALTNYPFYTTGTFVATDETWTV